MHHSWLWSSFDTNAWQYMGLMQGQTAEADAIACSRQ